jgi:hypothetical protein
LPTNDILLGRIADFSRMRDHRDMNKSSPALTMPKLKKFNALCAASVSAALLSACVVTAGADPSTNPSGAPAPVMNKPPVATMSGPVLTAPPNTPRAPARGTDNNTTTSLMREIALEIGDATCDTDAQCRTLGVGAKDCGGPEGYVAWSSKVNGKGTRLSELAAAHSAARQAENERSGMRSNCSVTPDPGAVCFPRTRDGLRVCQTVQGKRNGAV